MQHLPINAQPTTVAETLHSALAWLCTVTAFIYSWSYPLVYRRLLPEQRGCTRDGSALESRPSAWVMHG